MLRILEYNALDKWSCGEHQADGQIEHLGVGHGRRLEARHRQLSLLSGQLTPVV